MEKSGAKRTKVNQRNRVICPQLGLLYKDSAKLLYNKTAEKSTKGEQTEVKKTQIKHPEVYRNFEHSRKKAIRAHCLECSGDSFAEVKKCPAKGCSLWAYRMGHEVNEDGSRRIVKKDALSGENGSEINMNDADDELYPREDAGENGDEKTHLTREVGDWTRNC